MGSGSLKLDIALQQIQRLYLDTAPLIYWVEGHTNYIEKMVWIVDLIESTPLQAITSVVTFTEAMSLPIRAGKPELAREYYEIFTSQDDYALLTVTAEIAISAAAFRARYGLRTPDAIHAATAVASGCDAILTNDRDFRRVQDLNVLVLDDLEL